MKIIQITDCHFDSGGAEAYFFELIDLLKKTKKYDVYSAGFGKKQISEKTFVYPDAKSNFSRYVARVTFNPLFYFKLRRWIKKVNPDIIHLHNINKATNSLLLACKGYKTIQTVHDFGLMCPSMWCVYKDDFEICDGKIGFKCMKHKCISPIHYPFLWWHNKSRNHLLKKQVSAFLVPGKKLEEYLKIHNFKNVYHIPLPLNLTKWKYSNKFEKGQILYVGALEKNKGVENLIEAFAILAKKNNFAKLLIVGGGSEEQNLKKQVSLLNLEKRVSFLGKIPREKIKQHYLFANVVVVPSIWMENSPVVIMEAMACGRPIVGTDRGGIPWMIEEGKTGFIVSAKDADAMAEKINFILNDKSFFEKFSKSARKRAKNLFDEKKHLKSLEHMYHFGIGKK